MASLLKWAKTTLRRSPGQSLRFPATGFRTINASEVLEEERFEAYRLGAYYPVNIGETFASRYQVVGKLGFGASSTTWLARNLYNPHYVTLKVYTRDPAGQNELEICDKLSEINPVHHGYPHVRAARDQFMIPREGGDHQCLVLKPAYNALTSLHAKQASYRLDQQQLKNVLIQMFRALDYMHSQCDVIHTNITPDSILHDLDDESIFDAFTDAEMEQPSDRKLVSGSSVFASRSLEQVNIPDQVVLDDFSSAVLGHVPQYHDAQPDIYRSPEVMLGIPWSYPIDIWNIGVMVWDLSMGKPMFHGEDPDGKGYSTRAHLAEVIGLLGLPPQDLIDQGSRSHEFFTADGQWKDEVNITQHPSLSLSDESDIDEERQMFSSFMRGMLQWRPEDRKTADQLLEDPWLYSLPNGHQK